jgi:hypothetical protein
MDSDGETRRRDPFLRSRREVMKKAEDESIGLANKQSDDGPLGAFVKVHFSDPNYYTTMIAMVEGFLMPLTDNSCAQDPVPCSACHILPVPGGLLAHGFHE